MAIRNIGNALLSGLSTDTKPTTYPTNSIIIETDTGNMYVYNGTSWVLKTALAGGDVYLTAIQTLTNKTVNTTDNSITATSQAVGDILANNGTKFIRKQRGTSLQILRTNSGATDIEWAALDNERVGKSVASGNNTTTIFNIAHGVGANPTYAFAQCSSLVNTFTYVTNSTNIVVTFTTAPPSGTNNVIIYWRVVA